LRTPLFGLGCLAFGHAACTSPEPQPAAKAPSVHLAPAPGSPFSVGPRPGQPVLADFTGDGRLDLAVGFQGTGDQAAQGFVSLFLGDGAGRFTAAGAPTAMGGDGLSLATGDIDGDGSIDLVTVEHDRYDVTILLGDGRGGLRQSPDSPVAASQGSHPHTHSIATADMNADGRTDLLTTNADDNTVSLLLGNEAGGFVLAPGSPFAADTHPYDGLTTLDTNADGALDVVVPNLHGNTVTVLLGDGRAGLRPAQGSPHAVGPRPGYLAAGDLDGDGAADLVVTHDDDPMIHLLLGDGHGSFRRAANSPVHLPRTVWGVALADLNGDGRNDIVLGSYQGDALVLASSDGPAYLASPAPLALGAMPGRVVAGDVNGDGKSDLVASHHDSGLVSVWLQE
jgi:hypothetical protein